MFRFVAEGRRKAMPIVFETVAYDGKIIRLTEVQWLHAVFFYPEIEGEQEKMRFWRTQRSWLEVLQRTRKYVISLMNL